MDSSGTISDRNRAVFDQITDLVTSTDFNDASYQFLDKHKDTFTDDDENKLEYTTIFEEYVQILEKIIDSRLISTFKQDEITAFYMDFIKNH